jgi:hypothetical protein
MPGRTNADLGRGGDLLSRQAAQLWATLPGGARGWEQPRDPRTQPGTGPTGFGLYRALTDARLRSTAHQCTQQTPRISWRRPDRSADSIGTAFAVLRSVRELHPGGAAGFAGVTAAGEPTGCRWRVLGRLSGSGLVRGCGPRTRPPESKPNKSQALGGRGWEQRGPTNPISVRRVLAAVKG